MKKTLLCTISLCLIFFLVAPITSAGMDYPLPHRFDLRDINGKAYIGPVKDQSPFGTCYAFAANAAAESTYNRALDLYNDQAVSFSEPFIIWSLGQKYEGFGDQDFGEGANDEYDELQGLVDYGAIHAHVFPYTTEVMTAYDDDPKQALNYHWDAPRIRFSGWHRLPVNDIETFKRAIMTFGALDVAVLVLDDFQDYTGGIFTDSLTERDFPLEFSSSTNHSVSLVGWDDDEQVWILRNSWGPDWGEDGYMRISYNSARVGIEGAYLRFRDWEGTDHKIINHRDIFASLEHSGKQPVARGIYEWGGNHAFIVNQAAINSNISVQKGSPHVHGMFLWAGSHSRIENNGSITASAHTETGQATAYGIVLQGHEIMNTGTIQVEVEAKDEEQATAYGIRMFGFDDTAVLANLGTVSSQASGLDGWAYGLFSSGTSTLINKGSVVAEGNTLSAAVMTHNDTTVINDAKIEASTEEGTAYGVFLGGGRLTNSASGEIMAQSNQGESLGIYGHSTEYVRNEGTIQGHSVQGDAFGVVIQNLGTVVNHPGAVIAATSIYGEAVAVSLDNATLINNGIVTGDTLLDNDSLLTGTGIHSGDVLSNDSRVMPGSSIGKLTVTGDYHQDSGSTLGIEVDQTSSDMIEIFGTAILEGTLRIIPKGYVNDTSHSFLNATDISGNFSTIRAPAVFDITVTGSDSNLEFGLRRNRYASLVSNPAQAGMAGVLDYTRHAAAGDMADILNRLDSMDRDDLDRAIGNIYPAMHGAAGYSVLGNIQRNNRYLQQQMDRAASIRFTDPPRDNSSETDQWPAWRSWATATGSETRHHSHQAIPGFREKTVGIMAGADYHSKGNTFFGAALSVSSQHLDGRMDIGKSAIQSYQGYLYSQWAESSEGQGAYLNTGLGAGIAEIKTDRSIHFLNRKASSEYTAQTASLFLGTGYGFKHAGWLVRPGIDMGYAFLHENSFSESGAGSMTLDVDSRSSYSLQSHIGMNISKKLLFETGALMPEFRIGWIREFFPDSRNINARFHGDLYSFDAPGRDIPRNSGILGTSLKTRFSTSVFGAFDYEYYFMEANQGTAHRFNARLQYLF